MLSLVISTVVVLLSGVQGHSWVECTDYDMSIDIDADSFVFNDFQHGSCSGYARNRKRWTMNFGDNSGIDYELFTDGNNMCKDSIGTPGNSYSESYDTTFPMANYVVGSTYRLIWPAKNHADYGCHVGGDQLDNAMQVWVNLQPNPTSDLGNDVDTSGWTLVIDWHAESGLTFNQVGTDGNEAIRSFQGIDGVPFQNCPHFCDRCTNPPCSDNEGVDSMDKSVCYGDFIVPDIFPQDGYYTFLWYWEFKANEIYTHCFEAYVTTTPETSNNDDSGDTPTGTDEVSDGCDCENSALSEGEDEAESTDGATGAIIGVCIVLGVLLILCLGGCVCKQMGCLVCHDGGCSLYWKVGPKSVGNVSSQGLTSSPAGGTQAVVAVVEDDGARPTGATGARPPPPRVPPRH